jgi:hypothetical protein
MSDILSIASRSEFYLNYGNYIIDSITNYLFGENECVLLDNKGNDILQNYNIDSVQTREKIVYPEHNMQSGASLSDHAYEKTKKAQIGVVTTDPNQVQYLRSIYKAETELTLQTADGTMANMRISNFPVSRRAKEKNLRVTQLSLKEVEFKLASTIKLPPEKVVSPKNQSTVKNGQASSKEVPKVSNGTRNDNKGSSIAYSLLHGGSVF